MRRFEEVASPLSDAKSGADAVIHAMFKVVDSARNAPPPRGPSMWLLVIAILLIVGEMVASRVISHKYVKQFGVGFSHEHAD